VHVLSRRKRKKKWYKTSTAIRQLCCILPKCLGQKIGLVLMWSVGKYSPYQILSLYRASPYHSVAHYLVVRPDPCNGPINQINYPSIYLFIYPSIYLSIFGSQPFVGPWPLFSFLILYTVGRTPLTGDQPVARPLPIHRTETQNKCTQTTMPQMGFEPTTPLFERAKWPL
jgi:hypothetical protein